MIKLKRIQGDDCLGCFFTTKHNDCCVAEWFVEKYNMKQVECLVNDKKYIYIREE